MLALASHSHRLQLQRHLACVKVRVGLSEALIPYPNELHVTEDSFASGSLIWNNNIRSESHQTSLCSDVYAIQFWETLQLFPLRLNRPFLN